MTDALKESRDRLLKACQMAYRKHVAGDDSVGWDELGEVLAETLAEEMGDREFCRWIERLGADKSILDDTGGAG